MRILVTHHSLIALVVGLISSVGVSQAIRTDITEAKGTRTLVLSTTRNQTSFISHRTKRDLFSISLQPEANTKKMRFSSGGASLEQQADLLTYSVLQNGSKVEFVFNLDLKNQGFRLVAVSGTKLHDFFDEAGYDEVTDTSAVVVPKTTVSCNDDQLAKTQAVAQTTISDLAPATSGRSFEQAQFIDKTCAPNQAEIASAFAALTDVKTPNSYLNCISKTDSAEATKPAIEFIRNPSDKHVVRCSRSAPISSVNSSREILTIGQDVLQKPDVQRTREVLLHEVLHVGLVADELKVDDLVKCCSGRADSDLYCARNSAYTKLLSEFDASKYEGSSMLLHRINESSLSADAKVELARQVSSLLVNMKDKAKQSESKEFATLAKQLNKSLSDLCMSKLNSNVCGEVKAELNKHLERQAVQLGERTFVVAERQMADNIGKTPAVAATTQGPPVPQNLEVRPPDANRLARVRDQMEEYSKPYRALTEQLGTATRSMVANIAPVSPAVASTSRRSATTSRSSSGSTRVASTSGSFTATVTSVKNDEFQIQMPDDSIASGWVPFTKNGYGTPQIKVTPPPTSRGISAGTLAQSDSDETTRPRKGSVPTRIPRESTTASTGGGGQTQAGGGGGVGGGGSSPTVTRSPSGGAGAQLDFSTARLKEISEIKLQLVRSAKPEEAIKARIPDLRRLSIQVYYNGEPYPADLQNPETTLDLNRYRGNR